MSSSDPITVPSTSLEPSADAILDSAAQSPLISAEPRPLPETATQVATREGQDASATVVDETIRNDNVTRARPMWACNCATISASVVATKSSTPVHPTPKPYNLWGRVLWTVLLLAVLAGPTLVRHSFAPDSFTLATANQMPTVEPALGVGPLDASSAVSNGPVDDDNDDAHRCYCMCPAKKTPVVGTFLVGPDGSRCVCACDQPRPAQSLFEDLMVWIHAGAVAHGPLVLGIAAVSVLCYAATALVF
ncbi:hypothetical protein TW95_gp0388 [Pandoravirus inopinatum]|uniref:Transmembrane protein n=1 Tax=Pandoravirus inopinatum TaxID=1605721 RepID=A0A0B5JC13_9VIRU|nr:hypothetical protein TW95_gp0388 [Pandoravirus inopinatum]AJF97122.1 hypothetical protein [Pandoravirus inopinatum]